MNKSIVSYTILVALLVITSIVSIRLFVRQRSDHDLLDVHVFPHTIGDWKGADLEVTEKEYRILETRNLISREYTNSANEQLHLFIVYSETNRSVFHPPEVCLIGSGVTINDITNEKFNAGKNEFLIKKLYLEKNKRKDVALYCYKAGNFYTNNYYLQQVYFILNQLLGKRRGGATIRVSMPMRGNEEETVAVLKKFMQDVTEILEELS